MDEHDARKGELLGQIPEVRATDDEERRLVLRCQTGARPGERYVLEGSRALLGRGDRDEGIAPEMDLTSQEAGRPQPSVSRRHAEVVQTHDGWAVVDLGSLNGTSVNDVRLEPGRRHPLRAGDRLKVGDLVLVAEKEP